MSAPLRKRTRLAKRPGVSRRLFLKGLGVGGSSAALLSACGGDQSQNSLTDSPTAPSGNSPGCGTNSRPTTLDSKVFAHGVATGDPTASSMIFWTRVSEASMPTIPVTLEIYRDADLKQIHSSHCGFATQAKDYTVKLDIDGLEAATTYWYVFKAGAASSRIGRTRTAPSGGAEAIKFGVVSCSSLAHGFF